MSNEALVFWLYITRMGDTTTILILAGFVVVGLLLFGYVRHAVAMTLGLTGVQIVVQLMKMFTAVPRPPHGMIEALGYAFPSGHAATAPMVYAVVSIWLTQKTGNRGWVVLGFVLATLIAVSRVVLLVHTPLQVIAGACIGWIGVWLVTKNI
ncbi:MAG: phosphatase PAP2 family protein [bacterium]|nr:phosphatase PAP2 family protein [bacterium]